MIMEKNPGFIFHATHTFPLSLILTYQLSGLVGVLNEAGNTKLPVTAKDTVDSHYYV